MYFGDLEYSGHAQDFSKDPAWIGVGNRANFEDHELVGAHDFGYSAKTSFAGGSPGEVGGILWRGLPFSFYADHVGPLNLEKRLEANGKVILSSPPDPIRTSSWAGSTARPGPIARELPGILSVFTWAAPPVSVTISFLCY